MDSLQGGSQFHGLVQQRKRILAVAGAGELQYSLDGRGAGEGYFDGIGDSRVEQHFTSLMARN